MRLATWNVNSLGVRLPQVLDWLAHPPKKPTLGADPKDEKATRVAAQLKQPVSLEVAGSHGVRSKGFSETGLGEADCAVEVLALQETKTADEKFPTDAFTQAGYHVAFHGQKTYNGVALISKYPLQNVVKNIPGFQDELARVISATLNGVRVIGAYFPNGQAPGSDKFEYKMRWLTALHDWIKGELLVHPKLVIMGDFNITFDERDVWDPVALEGTIHCTSEERAHLNALIGLGLVDAFREFEQGAKFYSWWDYREFAFKRNRGLRIDHILVSAPLKAQLNTCFIDKAPRKNERPSDHTPVIADI